MQIAPAWKEDVRLGGGVATCHHRETAYLLVLLLAPNELLSIGHHRETTLPDQELAEPSLLPDRKSKHPISSTTFREAQIKDNNAGPGKVLAVKSCKG